jgi:hypothetical protein
MAGFQMNKPIDDGRAGCSLTACVDVAAVADQRGGSRVLPAFDQETDRSPEDDWRISLHEAGHVVIHRHFGDEVCGVTIVADADSSGRTWGPQGAQDAAVWNAESVFEPGMSRDGDVHGVFSRVQAGIIALMGGCAAEMTFLGDAPPKYIGSDVPAAHRVAGLLCRTPASIAAFVEHGYQESLALIEQNSTIVIAVAQALLNHPKRTLNGFEIDVAITSALAAKATTDEHKRRADWRCVENNAAEFEAKRIALR